MYRCQNSTIFYFQNEKAIQIQEKKNVLLLFDAVILNGHMKIARKQW